MSYFRMNILGKKKNYQFWVQTKIEGVFWGSKCEKLHYRAFLSNLIPKNTPKKKLAKNLYLFFFVVIFTNDKIFSSLSESKD